VRAICGIVVRAICGIVLRAICGIVLRMIAFPMGEAHGFGGLPFGLRHRRTSATAAC
jgi:hypothetical protein